MDYRIQAKGLDLAFVIKKNVKLDVQADQRVNVRESENLDKYLDLPREQKKLRDMLMIGLPTIAVTFRIFLENMEKKKKGKMDI